MGRRSIEKILIANRGEIAVRIIRACHELGIRTVAIFSEADRNALHVRLATEAYCVGPAPSAESYLQAERILNQALEAGASAVHPGYGFLSENAGFAEAVQSAGLVWIGPSPDAIRAMGSKTESRARMSSAGVPVVPGTTEAVSGLDEALQIAQDIGFPVMLKASAGGGGKGMRRVASAAELEQAFESARSEAQSSFGDPAVYLEKLIVNPRHVEIQVLADSHGKVLHLFERDCSIQRRNQKVLEETPCPALKPETREAMAQVAVQAAEAVAYEGAGTVEFLLAEDGSFYFLEMNTRLQVEHPITEMVTGIDLVKAQIRLAAGEELWLQQDDLVQRGHAIECRVYAENPGLNWAPSPGLIQGYREPGGPWVRVDSGVYEGSEVPIHYDPMVAKLIVWGVDRDDAIQRMARALREYRVRGIQTTLSFFRALLEEPDFLRGGYDTGFLDTERMNRLTSTQMSPDQAIMAAVIHQLNRDFDRSGDAAGAVGPAASQWRWSFSP